ncbi:MAG: helix-turn-helix domain-containing protein [Caulobacteraceae bacterium]|nr:helix-turn-helix domain-containing protein [Caulobacteraceae bacterium]
MSFPSRLVAARKMRAMTQVQLANATGINLSQIKRYEGGQSQPSLDGILRLAVALHVSTDMLLFEEAERGPDEEFKHFLEALSTFGAEEKATAKAVLQGLVLQHQARRWAKAS